MQGCTGFPERHGKKSVLLRHGPYKADHAYAKGHSLAPAAANPPPLVVPVMTPPWGRQKPLGPQALVPSQLVLPVQAEDQPQGHQKPVETTPTPLPSAGIILSCTPNQQGVCVGRNVACIKSQSGVLCYPYMTDTHLVEQRPVLTGTGKSSNKP